MSQDYVTELVWKNGHVFLNSHKQTQRPSVPPPILHGSGSGGGLEENAQLPQPPSPLLHHQLIDEDEMASWLQNSDRESDIFSDLILPGVAPTPANQPLSSVSLTPPPPSVPYDLPSSERSVENFSRSRGNIFTGSRVEAAGPWVPPVVRQSTPQMGSSTETRATEIAGTSSIQIQPATETETETADDWKLKERKENADEIEKAKEGPGSAPRKRSRAAEMHNISEKMMYTPEMQRFMPHMSMGMNIDFSRPAHMAGQGPSYPDIQDQQPDPAPNQPQFPVHLNPYSEFVGLHQMQHPHLLLQSQTTAQLSFSQASSTSELEDQENQPTR